MKRKASLFSFSALFSGGWRESAVAPPDRGWFGPPSPRPSPSGEGESSSVFRQNGWFKSSSGCWSKKRKPGAGNGDSETSVSRGGFSLSSGERAGVRASVDTNFPETGSQGQTGSAGTSEETIFSSCFLSIALVTLFAAQAIGQTQSASNTDPNKSTPIPMDQLGAVAGKQYHGDGLSVTATPDGARLRCAFQRLEGYVTHEGLWLSSTADTSSGERFRVMAVKVGRADDLGFGDRFRSAPVLGRSDANMADAFEQTTPPLLSTFLRPGTGALRETGVVSVTENVARFIRDGLTEEYTVSVDGVRQDFIVEQRPGGEGELRVELDVTGAKAEPLVNGVRLVLDGSGRKLAYNRLRVVDATGRELPARMEVAAGVPPAVEGAHPAARNGRGVRETLGDFSARLTMREAFPAGLEAPALRQAETPATTRLAVLVDDAAAIYPVRIDPTFSDADWISMGGIPGANKYVYAAAVDNVGNLYIGGDFTIIGDVFANGIAKWDGNGWSPLGSGMNDSLRAIAVAGTNLYAGGDFTTAGGIPANFIAKWDGNAWSPLGSGMNDTVRALMLFGNELLVGGTFTTAGGTVANRFAKWNGATWSTLGTGMDDAVNALAVSGATVYAGGQFSLAGGNVAYSIAKWSGGVWSALGSGMNDPVNALAVSGTTLYAGGSFTTAGGNAANRIAKWNGTAWSALGSGMNDDVIAMVVSGTQLYVGGYFTVAGGTAANRIARWNGNAWSVLGSGMGGVFPPVYALAASGTNLFAGGVFTTAGEQPANYIAKWNGSVWSQLGSGMNNLVYALAVSGTNLYAGGGFATTGGGAANYIAKWDGSAWSALGAGMNDAVYALAVSGSNLYAGGAFTNAGGTAASRIAKWDGSAWSALGSGVNSSVYALAMSDTNLYAGGDFTTAGGTSATNIAKWNGSAWSPLGSGMNSTVYALAVSGTDLYAGGSFWTVGGDVVGYIAKWDGSVWSALGSGMDSIVYALAVSGTDLYAGGDFTTANGNTATHVAKWDGSAWSALGSGLGYDPSDGDTVVALVVSGTDIFAGGYFGTAGGTTANYIAKWDGSTWSALGSGMNGTVNALAVSGTNLYVGGGFTKAGNKVSGYAAKANIGAARGRFSNMIHSPGTGFSCTFLDGSVGQPYRIQTSPSLAAGSWIDFTNFTYAVPVVINVPAAAATNQFFRAITP
ncbi:MAG: hypothetical protein HOP33_04385 [Verrucomicrobia bacterium]|nr:hypothetical protein [Verrucomicrobiota bacterium]